MGVELLDGRFLKIRFIGEGKAGKVFEAVVTKNCDYAKSGQKVVIKEYKPWVLDQPNQAKRIVRELRAGKTVKSRYVVKTHEIASDQGRLFLVMELLKGITLSEWIKNNSSPYFSTIEEICLKIADGLYSIHESNLIHRDIKPDNIMITETGPVIMDLGVVRDLNAASDVTLGQFLGTIRYAAPDYLFGEKYDNKIDSYSFGAILLELVLGKPLIGPEAYWSMQILLKGQMKRKSYFDDYKFDEEMYDRLGFRESRFLASILEGTLVGGSSLLSMGQIYLAFKNRVWEKTFLHYVDRVDARFWPDVPPKLENEVSNFIVEYKRQDLIKFSKYLHKTAAISPHLLWGPELNVYGHGKGDQIKEFWP